MKKKNMDMFLGVSNRKKNEKKIKIFNKIKLN